MTSVSMVIFCDLGDDCVLCIRDLKYTNCLQQLNLKSVFANIYARI